uniref:Type II toxin-antitoxin system MqsA family antitoxin n=1 Tax=Geobacter metallireducens TaxID=28232 RepID=A0A831UCG3_GEOME
MKCVICKHGEVSPGFVTVTLERDRLTMVVKHVPARVCDNCGEEYLDEEIASKLFRTADEMARSGAQIDVREYKAA